MIRLTVLIELEGHDARALTHESNARSIIMGRDASADFQIPLTTVSRHHSRISETDNVYVIEDLGSTHGTLVNGKKVPKGEKKVLRDGDIIELTRAKITCNIEMEKVAMADPDEGTQAIAAKAVQGILGRLGDGDGEGPYFRVLTGGPDEGQQFKMVGSMSEWSLGRSKDCEFVLNDPNVSRKHATVRKDWNGYTISDLGSKNGVQVNDRTIGKPRRLKDRDEITIGPVKLVFIDPDADLMAALSDVPGFEIEEQEDEPEFVEGDPSVVGAPEDQGELGDIPEPDGGEGGLGDGGEPEEEEDEYANIDPALLEGPKRKFPIEFVIIGIVSLLIIGGVILLIAILG